MTREETFSVFWSCYPRRIGKGTARKAFDKAIKKTTLEAMLDAITKYVANKPAYSDYKHPSTWLNAECWDDEWEPTQSKATLEQQSTYITRIKLSDEYRAARDEGRHDRAAELRNKLSQLTH